MRHFHDQERSSSQHNAITELKLQEAIGYIPNAIIVINDAGLIALANASAEQLFGYKPEELLHMPVEQLIPERFRQIHALHFATYYQRLEKRMVGTVNELFARHHDGSEIPVEISLNPIHTTSGIFILASIIDTFRRQQAEQAQHQSEERFHELVESTKIIPWEADGQTFRFTYVGPQAVRIMGYPIESWYRDNFWVETIHPEDQDAAINFCHAAATKHKEYEFDYRMITADQRIIWFHDIVRVKPNPDGSKTLHGFLIDITGRKQIEIERQALLEIMHGVVMNTDLLHLLGLIHHAVARVIYAENFFVTLHNKTTGLFEEAYSVDKYDPPSQPYALGKSITHYVFRTGQPLLLTPERFATLLAQGEVELVGTDSPSWLGVPLQTSSETIGVMVVQHYEEANCYSEQDVAFFVSIAGQVAMVIERKWREEKLRESEERYRSLIENLPIGVYRNTPGPQGHFLMANTTFVRMFGFKSLKELESVTVADLYTNPEERQLFSTRLLSQGSVTGAELHLKKRDGTPLWGSVTATVAYDKTGEPVHFDCTVEDITPRKQAELDARHRADEFAALYEITHDLALQWTLPRLLETVLSRTLELLQAKVGGIYLYNAEQDDLSVAVSQGGSFPTGVRLDIGEGLAGRVAKLRQPILLDDYHSWTERSPIYEHLSIQAIVGVPMIYGGELIGVLLVEEIGESNRRFTDNDVRLLSLLAGQAASAVHNARLYEQVQRYAETLEQRVAERTQELAQANEQLTVLDRLKSRFVADVSHELRTPVSSLKLYLDLLDRNPTGNQERYMRVLHTQTERLQDLIENILDLSRLELGWERIPFEPIDLNETVEQVVMAYQLRAQAKGLTLTFTPTSDLPQILSEPKQLAQVVTNLITNGLNYTDKGFVQVSTHHHAGQAQVTLEVRDSGSGIPSEDKPHLFQRFYRGNQHRQGGIPGTGLGLAIVKEIIDLHQGQIEVESQVNQGTMFRIHLPVYQEDDEVTKKGLVQNTRNDANTM
jgi:PAS domain S-box-containing protein